MNRYERSRRYRRPHHEVQSMIDFLVMLADHVEASIDETRGRLERCAQRRGLRTRLREQLASEPMGVQELRVAILRFRG